MSFVDAVRARPGMYLGSTDSLGMLHLYEYAYSTLFAAGLKHHLRVRRDGARVVIESDCVLEAESLVAKLEDYDGVFSDPCWPLLTVSAVSSRFELDVLADDGWWSWRGERGVPGAGEPLQRRSGPGTTISFTPDTTIFKDTAGPTAAALQRRLQELAMLHPGLLVELDDASGVRFALRWPRGLVDYLEAEHAEVVRAVETTWKGVRVRAAFARSETRPPPILAFANTVRVRGGGHVDALRAAVDRCWPRSRRLSSSWRGVIAVDMPPEDVKFEGPTREVLAVEGLREGVTRALVDAFGLPAKQRRAR